MPLVQAKGAASARGVGQFARQAPAANYIEDVFSTTLYTQNTSGVRIPLVTGVGSVASSAWQANSILVTSSLYLSSCAVDASGNYYQAAANQNDGCFVAKYSATGATLWLVKIRIDAGATGSTKVIYPVSIKVAASGNIYIAGRRPASACLIKLNSSGVTQWTRELGASISGDQIALALDASENSHVVYTSGALQGQYARFNSSGTQDTGVSKVFYTATQTFAQGVDVDSSGNVYVCGNYYDTTYYYAFIIKFNSSMVSQWARVLTRLVAGGNGFNSVSVDGSGNVYVAGNFRSASSTSVAGIAKYSGVGTLQWQKQINPASGSISNVLSKTDQGGNTCLVGYNNSNWLISKIDTSGALSWNSDMIAAGAANNGYPTDVAVDGAGGLFVAGEASEDLVLQNRSKPRVLKISADGTSNGVTVFGALTSASYSISNGSWSEITPSFTVSSGSSFSAVTTYLSAADSVATTFYSIPLSTATDAMVWSKSRSALGNNLVARSTATALITNSSSAESASTKFKALTSNGVLIESDYTTDTNVLWTFRKQAKFFDVVTWTGDGTTGRRVSHSLGSTPGCIIIKRTNAVADWWVWHRSNSYVLGTAASFFCVLSSNTTTATGSGYSELIYFPSAPDASTFSVVSGDGGSNATGGTFVAYVFAHDAGGFGAAGTDNVISCGSYTGNGSASGPSISLGWEPQWLMIKNVSASGSWRIIDNMRGMPVGSADATLQANASSAESALEYLSPTATGFQITSTNSEVNTNAATYIYVAIRRGPMRTPTSGTSVFSPSTYTLPSAPLTVTTGFPIDLSLSASTNTTAAKTFILTLTQTGFATNQASTEFSLSNLLFNNTGLVDSGWWATGFSSPVYWNFRRAPNFFDVVCYSGTGSTLTINHNLQVAPEMAIVKRRNSASYSWVYHSSFLPLSNSYAISLYSNQERFTSTPAQWISALSTNQLTLSGSSSDTNAAGGTYMASLFASCPGVSKVGSYTGTGVGVAQTINCGFTTGARFVLIKRSVGGNGDWYVYDSARGISASNDPFIFLNTTAAQNTSTDYISPQSSGFGLTATAPSDLNASGSTYIFLAIA